VALKYFTTASVSGGIGCWLTRRPGLGVDVCCSPLSVTRRAGMPAQKDGLFSVRAAADFRPH
jgi:hypothetical protein